MATRILILAVLLFTIGLTVSVAVAADTVQRGTVISVAQGRLTITDHSLIGHQHSYVVGAAVPVTLNRSPVPLTQLERGDRVTVVMTNDQVSAVGATRRFPPQ